MTKKQFMQAAQLLHNEIEYQGLDTEVIREFLCTFAEHILVHVVPNDLQESSIKKPIREIVQSIDDMESKP